jgi:hypothetical protein
MRGASVAIMTGGRARKIVVPSTLAWWIALRGCEGKIDIHRGAGS